MQTLQTITITAPCAEKQHPEIEALDEFAHWLLSSSTPRPALELRAGHIALSLYRSVTDLAPAHERHWAGIVTRVLSALKQAQADEQAAK